MPGPDGVETKQRGDPRIGSALTTARQAKRKADELERERKISEKEAFYARRRQRLMVTE